jgi:hypothetical protein
MPQSASQHSAPSEGFGISYGEHRPDGEDNQTGGNAALRASISTKGAGDGKGLDILPSLGLTSDLDVYRAANILVKEYGAEQAPLLAARRADVLLERGDVDGQRVWKAVLRAVEELIRTARKPNEQLN